jgi:hypothetical protein
MGFQDFVSAAIFGLAAMHSHLQAWHDAGHMIVAEIAYERLKPEVRRTVDQLTVTFKEFYPNNVTCVTCSVWADEIKGNSGHGYMHAFDKWHYINIPFDPDDVLSFHKKELIKASTLENNVAWIIEQAKSTLSHRDSQVFEKALMFNMLVHCVGDIHQPLHCCTRYSKRHPEGDRGGTRFQIQGSPEHNLHHFWDAGAGYFPNTSFPARVQELEVIKTMAKELTEKYPPEFFANVGQLNPDQWVHESYALATTVVYTLPENSTPNEEYIKGAQEVSKQRVTLAGYRLAAVINKIFENNKTLSPQQSQTIEGIK